MVRDPQGAIDLCFHLHVRGPDRVVNLIELPLMGNGEVLPEAPGGLDAQAPVQLPVRRRRPMPIGYLRRFSVPNRVLCGGMCRHSCRSVLKTA